MWPDSKTVEGIGTLAWKPVPMLNAPFDAMRADLVATSAAGVFRQPEWKRLLAPSADWPGAKCSREKLLAAFPLPA
jgi:hypothetical protein